jgi:hypothetical protein
LKTPVETLLAVLDLGGRLGPAGGNRLRAWLPPNCPAELRESIRAHKTDLLVLLAFPDSLLFVVVRSEILPPWVFWTADDAGRNLLIAHGAPREIVYTRDELAAITQANPDAKSLTLMRECKRLFGSRFLATLSYNE